MRRGGRRRRRRAREEEEKERRNSGRLLLLSRLPLVERLAAPDRHHRTREVLEMVRVVRAEKDDPEHREAEVDRHEQQRDVPATTTERDGSQRRADETTAATTCHASLDHDEAIRYSIQLNGIVCHGERPRASRSRRSGTLHDSMRFNCIQLHCSIP